MLLPQHPSFSSLGGSPKCYRICRAITCISNIRTQLQKNNQTPKKNKKVRKVRLFPAPAPQRLSRSSPSGFEKNLHLINIRLRFFIKTQVVFFSKTLTGYPSQPITLLSFFFLFRKNYVREAHIILIGELCQLMKSKPTEVGKRTTHHTFLFYLKA